MYMFCLKETFDICKFLFLSLNIKVDEEVDMGPFLSVIRNSLEDGERLKEII